MAVEIFFMTKSPSKNVAGMGIELGAACMPSRHASDRVTAPGTILMVVVGVSGAGTWIFTIFQSNPDHAWL